MHNLTEEELRDFRTLNRNTGYSERMMQLCGEAELWKVCSALQGDKKNQSPDPAAPPSE